MEPEGDFAIIVNTSTTNHISPARGARRGAGSELEAQGQNSNCTAARVSRMGRTVEAMNA